MAIPSEILKKIRAIELRTRRLVTTSVTGDYHAAFKGQGLHFAEVREYQVGDDVRRIDWNVTAKTGSPFVKIFEEERELQVILMVDVSGSGYVGSAVSLKVELAAEVAAVLGFSASVNRDRVGLLLFSDRIETFIPPKKGKAAIWGMLGALFGCKPQGKGTNLAQALAFFQKAVRKKSIVFLVSDFLDSGYESSLKRVAKRHDLVPIVLEDPLESQWPASGRWLLEDAETGAYKLVNMRHVATRQEFAKRQAQKKADLDRFLRSIGSKVLRLSTAQPYLIALRRYFQSGIKS